MIYRKSKYQKNLKDNHKRCTKDRIDPTKGYTKDNIQIISHRANTIKSNASLEELEKVYLFMKGINDAKK